MSYLFLEVNERFCLSDENDVVLDEKRDICFYKIKYKEEDEKENR